MDRISRTARGVRTAVGAVVAVVLVLACATSAFALTNVRVTLDQQTGGKPTRFTVVADTDKDVSIPSLDVVFPKGFDASKVTFRVVTLEGLKRIAVDPIGTPKPDALSLTFDPAIKPGSNLRVEVYNVITPIQGGTYKLKLAYAAESTATGSPVVSQRTVETNAFSYATPPLSEAIANWLDQQAGVTSFNNVKAFGMFFKPQLIIQAIPLLFFGWLLALSLVALGFPAAIAGGLALAFMKMSRIAPVRWIAGAYVNVIRGTPLFLQIFVAFIGLRIAGVRTSDYVTAVAVLAINSSAYLAEIFRAGIQSIHRGQFEAASSLGMTYRQSMQYVIIPQTVKRVLPTMTSEFILLFKDTALFAAVGIGELMYGAQNIVANTGNMTAFVVAAAYYLIITTPLINLVGKLEARLAVSEHGHTPSEQQKRPPALTNGLTRTAAPERSEAEAEAALSASRRPLE